MYTGSNPLLLNPKTSSRFIPAITSNVAAIQFPEKASRPNFIKSDQDKFSNSILTDEMSLRDTLIWVYEYPINPKTIPDIITPIDTARIIVFFNILRKNMKKLSVLYKIKKKSSPIKGQ